MMNFQTPKTTKKQKVKIVTILFFALIVFSGLWCINELKENNASSLDCQTGQNELKQTLLDLQAMGERQSWAGQSKASEYLKRRINQLGLTPVRQVYSYEGQEWENLWMTLPGTAKTASRIIVFAHFDSTSRGLSGDAPGADDNGSGVAVLLEIAKLLGRQPLNNDVQVVFFSNEEDGHEGSKAFASQLRREGVPVIGVLNIDIVGYNNPTALFSKKVIDVLAGELPTMKKSKMILKMAYNLGTRLIEKEKVFVVAGRSEDKTLQPKEKPSQLEVIKWKFGDSCA
ncbi:MAG: M20/M25/M40 family metallo-hydrolase [Proteobacteria bacterium]|nr:M20/M25/M40 family metallo-hydrolase [Pseudomonadota bacterium]